MRSTGHLRGGVRLLAIAAIGLAVLPSTPLAASPAPWPAYTESSGCDQLRTWTPLALAPGALSQNVRIAGPYGALFGRTVGDVVDSLVWWTVPMSDDKRVQVHERALPAFEQVTANLAAAETAGLYYPIGSVSGFVPRTVAGKRSISYHAFGAAIDINPSTNPDRRDNVLVTDMPEWFVQAWTSAGFCWGGDWLASKDSMHFSWKGPEPTPGYSLTLAPYPPASEPGFFTEVALATVATFGARRSAPTYVIADSTGNGAADVVQLVQAGAGVIVGTASATRGFSEHGVEISFASGVDLERSTVIMGDFEATGRNDLWEVAEQGGVLTVTIHLRSAGLEPSAPLVTRAVAGVNDRYLSGDVNRDGHDDLFVIRRGERTSVEVWDGASGFATRLVYAALPLGESAQWFAVGDRDVDGYPDIYAMESSAGSTVVSVLTHASGYTVADETFSTSIDLTEASLVALGDYDGDGRDDLYLLDSSGRLTVYLGGVSDITDPDGWFMNPGYWQNTDPYSFL